MPDLDEFMTTQEAATRLGFHIKTNPMMLRNKTLGDIRFGRAWLVSNFTEPSISAD
jgi:excisionase family DNA binding protein